MHFKTLQDPKFDIEFSIFSQYQGRQTARHIALKNLAFIKHKVSFLYGFSVVRNVITNKIFGVTQNSRHELFDAT